LHPVAIGSPFSLENSPSAIQMREGMASNLLPTLRKSSHWAVVLETYVQGYEEQERQSNTPEAASITGCISENDDVMMVKNDLSWVPNVPS
jgi:diaminopimelate decarboxylase